MPGKLAIPMQPYPSFSQGKFLPGSMFALDNFSPFETTSVSWGAVAEGHCKSSAGCLHAAAHTKISSVCIKQTRPMAGVLGKPKKCVFELPRALSCYESGFCAALICFCTAGNARKNPASGCCCAQGVTALTGWGGRFKVLWFCHHLSQEEPIMLALPLKAQQCPWPTQPCGQTASASALH